SSLNFIILPISSALGILPASESLSAGTNTITRMSRSLLLGTHARVEDRTHLGLALELGPVLTVQLHELGRDARHFLFRLRLEDRPTTDDFLAFRERPIGDGDLALGQAHPDALIAGQKTARVDQRALFE